MRLISIRANKEHFRPVDFQSGFNMVVAERTIASKDTDSRNGVGKTTLFQIIDFCLGGRVAKDDSLEKLRGNDWEFSLTLGFDDELTVTVTRALDEPGSIQLAGDVPELELGDAALNQIGPRAWTTWLGERFFGLDAQIASVPYGPTFRRLFGHFLRFRSEAYISAFETFRRQPPHQVQADNAFLLGLDWRLATEWQRWKDRSKALGVLGKKELDELGERLGELESQRVRAESKRRRTREQIENFEVLPEYREVETRANQSTAKMQTFANEVTMNARLLDLYRDRLATEEVDDSETVLAAFAEAGVQFGDALQHTLGEIVEFHSEVARNRQEYLAAEVARIENAQGERRQRLQHLEEERRRDLSLLETHGALDDFAELQQRLGSTSALVETLAGQIEELREIRKGKTALKIAQLGLEQRTSLDVEQRVDSIAAILEDFSETLEETYGEPADLVVDVGQAGYQFRVALPKQGSHGVGKVGVFAYDLAITNAWTTPGRGVGFLGHDSIVFDGVDERQTASAISRAVRAAEDKGFQYLLTINSDDLPGDRLSDYGIDIEEATILTLTDSDPTGGLLGIRV